MWKRLSVTTVLSLSLVFFSSIHAGSIADVDFEDQVTVGGKSLQLNGMGLRTATALKVKIYAIGLYLEEKNPDPKAIIQSAGNKRIRMHWMHDVSADDITEGWTEGFENNTKDISGIKAEIERFNASMQDMEDGGELVLDISGGKVEVLINGTSVETIEGDEFLQALLAIWLGPKPPNKPLKKGILGG